MIVLQDPRPDAMPDWDDLEPIEHTEHIDWCRDGCNLCADHRPWGECSTCGADTEAIGVDELSRCCGSRTIFRGPTEDNAAAISAQFAGAR